MSRLLPQVQEALDSQAITYKVLECDPDLADTAAFCEHYGFTPSQAANTIVAASKTDPIHYALCVVLATTKLDVNKKVCQLLEVKKASFASAEQTTALTAMMIGGVTPFGISDLPVYIDSSVLEQAEVVMGGGNRSTKVLLSPQELQKIPNVQFIDGLAKPRE